MGFRARKSFKVMPGVRMTVTPRGVSTSVGTRGARVSAHSSGRVTKSVGVPGTGMSYVSTSSASSRAKKPAAAPPARPAAPKPGFMAPKGEKALYAALVPSANEAKLREVATSFPDYAPVANMLLGLSLGDHAESEALLRAIVDSGEDPGSHAFTRKYLGASTSTVEIADGVAATLPLERDTIALVVAELLQRRGDLDGAIELVEQVDPSVYAALSLAELYVDAGRYEAVVELTNGTSNDDDPTALLCAFRGIALREQGYHDAAREAFKEALRSRSRAPGIRHRALIERARSYLAQGKKSQARRDLERVLAEDSSYPGLEALIDEACT